MHLEHAQPSSHLTRDGGPATESAPRAAGSRRRSDGNQLGVKLRDAGGCEEDKHLVAAVLAEVTQQPEQLRALRLLRRHRDGLPNLREVQRRLGARGR